MDDFRYVTVRSGAQALQVVRELVACGFQRHQIGVFSGTPSLVNTVTDRNVVGASGGIEDIGDFLDPSAILPSYFVATTRGEKYRMAASRAIGITRLMQYLVAKGGLAVVVRATVDDTSRRMERINELQQKFATNGNGH